MISSSHPVPLLGFYLGEDIRDIVLEGGLTPPNVAVYEVRTDSR